MRIINLTQHKATADQVEAGVVDLPACEQLALAELLTFDVLPTRTEIECRAHDIAELAVYSEVWGEGDHPIGAKAMIGGAPYLTVVLAAMLKERGFEPVFAFTLRVSTETVQPDGTVSKTANFKHAGWVPAL